MEKDSQRFRHCIFSHYYSNKSLSPFFFFFSIDLTRSNTWQGSKTFQGLNLHYLSDSPDFQNPYQQVISVVSDVLMNKLDDDAQIPLYGFGDLHTGNHSVFMMNNGQACHSKTELLDAYATAVQNVKLSGPTSFAPIIYEAIDQCKATGKYMILFIIADGMMDDVQQTIDAIVAASHYPLSIVTIGVGDGPWESMEEFDDDIPERAFDNFQFLSHTRLLQLYPDVHQRNMHFALEALMELPEQYQLIKKLGLLGSKPDDRVQFQHRLVGKHIFRQSHRAYPQVEGQEPPPYFGSR